MHMLEQLVWEFSAILRRRRVAALSIVSAAVFAAWLPATPCYAQLSDEGNVDIANDGAPTAPPAANDEGAEAAAPPSSDISYLDWAFRSLGWFYGLVFLGLSFLLLALFVMNMLTARRENVVPAALVEGFEQHLNAKQYQEAYDLAKADESFLGLVLSAGLAKVSSGYNEAIEAMQEVGEEENMRLEHRLSYLALIGSLSPMIGLLGTVSGMLNAFKEIANTAVGTPDPQSLAGDISTALFTTFVGLALAIPALAAYNLLRNQVQRLVLEVGIVSEGLMSRFQKTGDK